jgi:hypothetical protein
MNNNDFSNAQVTHTLTQSPSDTKHTEEGSALRLLEQSGNEPINTKCDVSQALLSATSEGPTLQRIVVAYVGEKGKTVIKEPVSPTAVHYHIFI